MTIKINIEGVIGVDVTTADVRGKLQSGSPGEDVMVHIASPGGRIAEGLSIYNELKNHPGKVNTHMSGALASMATYIAMVGERRTAEKNAVFMIHNGRMMAIGDHNVMFKAGNHLNGLTAIIAKEYAVKTGAALVDIRAAMDKETYYYGEEIKEAGFVHEIIGDEDGSAENRAEAVAYAGLMVEDCEAKMNNPEMLEKDFEALAIMMGSNNSPDADKHNAGGDNQPQEKTKQEKQEAEKMTYEELKKDHPELFARIHGEGKEAGVSEERARVKDLTEMRGKFKKPHSQMVIDTAIAEGHDFGKMNANLMAADQAADELAKEEKNKEKTKTPGGNDGVGDVPDMKDGVMTHVSHVDATSAKIAEMIGLKPGKKED